jgi:hypothetical protein
LRLKINWEFLIIVILTLPCVWLFGRYVFSKQKSTDYRVEILEVCEGLIERHTTENLKGVDPRIVPVGGGGLHSTSQPLALWKSEEFNVDIQCVIRFFGPNRELVIDKFIVNGEDKTNLVRREEREK